MSPRPPIAAVKADMVIGSNVPRATCKRCIKTGSELHQVFSDDNLS